MSSFSSPSPGSSLIAIDSMLPLLSAHSDITATTTAHETPARRINDWRASCNIMAATTAITCTHTTTTTTEILSPRNSIPGASTPQGNFKMSLYSNE